MISTPTKLEHIFKYRQTYEEIKFSVCVVFGTLYENISLVSKGTRHDM